MSAELLSMKRITKSFPGVNALKEVGLQLEAGEVHALLGENGAGKSTLIKVLGGIYQPDDGEIFVDGKKVTIEKVTDAQVNGISIIHQEIVLVPYLSIAENIYLGREPLTKSGFIDMEKMIEDSKKYLAEFGLDLNPRTTITELTVAQQQMIEIIKAVSFEAKIIVMDEPTSSLTDKEVKALFQTIRSLKKQQVGIIYISHRMEELFEITDRITVMRDGEYVGTVKTKETTHDQLVAMMVGRSLSNIYYREKGWKTSETVLEVHHLSKQGVIEDISFDLKKGEILGFSGLVGAGRSELMRCIFGIDDYDSGEILLSGKHVKIEQPNDAMNQGLAYVPESRKDQGLFLSKAVDYNMSIKILDQFIKGLRVNDKVEKQQVDHYINELNIKTPHAKQTVRNLSGGNQQKVLISRWLATKPNVLILDEPTRGVDVGAKFEIYSIMQKLVEEGVSIIMISSELPEVINMSDRVVVMYKGKVGNILEGNEIKQEQIMYYATGGGER
ncbi:sugar ABC transporter ATP-binding protein [Gracilibacillus thailandensis]|uniref:ATP-binding cassette domain-containing protein n=1 Tax=Gracilibacillus thailandensis TaxID=563735 RepID=A0A6N7QYG0_9BACI|nr:sugar ABC transporter ATP-binding protein [Gracilibacillus thailandensis]MRI67098.1 ATP-binding cassette domain-containing protein [Gracilibacillus thailandensis]